ncbi:hypothetical protein BH09BAC2_BH09BAC2_14990 [soil metagenome]
MKRLQLIVTFLFTFLVTFSQDAADITAAEYFVDTDPGTGNGIALSIGASGSTVNFIGSISTSSLPNGFHNVFIRTKDADGKWGLTEGRVFFVSQGAAVSADIISAEYYIDSDPGTGNGTQLNTGSIGGVVNFIASIPTASLISGFHNIYIRAKNASGIWGLYESRSFYISAAATDAAEITAAEYFYDVDPGPGNGLPISIGSPLSVYKDSLTLPLGSLPIGDHLVGIRVKNTAGQWSLIENKLFKVCIKDGPLSKMNFFIENNQVFFKNNSTNNDTTLWKFGDGTTDTVLSPIKTYGVAGNYNLQLITKNICGSDTISQLIVIKGITSVNAVKAGNTGVATVIFEGNGFTNTSVLKLVRGSTVLLPADKQFVSSRRIIAYFNLITTDTGKYHVVADLGGGPLDTLKNGFLVQQGRTPMISVSAQGRNPGRLGNMVREYVLQNQGNEDAIMLPFATIIGYKPNTLQWVNGEPAVDLTNKGIFQNTYQYLSSNSISPDVMAMIDVDTIRKKQLIAFYRVKVPSESYVVSRMRISNSFGLLEYDNMFLVHPPLFKSGLVLNDISAPNPKDCMNSFLKKAVKRNVSVTINDDAWNTCFNNAFDTLARSVRDIVKDISLQNQSIPMKSVYSTLLVQMAQCGSSGMPAALTSVQFQKIIKDVTYNWMFLENLDSIGRPCFDTTENFIFNSKGNISDNITGKANQVSSANCPGAAFFPELAELCADYAKPCDAVTKMVFQDDDLLSKIGRFVFKKLIGTLSGPGGSGGLCNINSAAIGCRRLCELTSVDPNIKSGPGDNSGLKHVNYLTNYSYTVFFENVLSATAPAAYIEVTDTIDMSKLDIKTFQTGTFGWGDSLVVPDANRTEYSLLKDLRPAVPNKLRIDVRIDTIKGIVKWKFFTLDTLTLQLTDDPAQGFLPPNVDGKQGVGFVSFSIKPKAGVTSGTVIENKASIVFDANAPLVTPVWQHIVDTTKPHSNVTVLPANVATADFVVNWSGTDAHAGIAEYAVFVSVNDSLYKQWKSFTTLVSDTFHGQFNKTYKFFSMAKDKADNFEDAPTDPYATPDAVTTPTSPVPVTLISFSAKKSVDGKKADLRWETSEERNVSHFEIQRSADGRNFTVLEKVKAVNAVTGNQYSLQDKLPLKKNNYYRLKIIDNDASYKMSAVKNVNFAGQEEVLVYPTLTSSLIFIQSENQITAELVNISGIKLQQKAVTGISSFDVSNISAGIYFIHIPGLNKNFKFIKQ